jgi:ubiquinone/menaquinone biosynthesis C-methylase UbiE
MKGYDFKLYDGMNIPFPSNFFDVVIANHVIEHVQDQAMTLSEVSRVLNDNGICYIAVPNKWSLIEPHFKFPFLSWFPQKFSDFIVQTFKKTNKFDVKSHGLKGYLSLMSDRFYVKNITYKFFKLPDSNIPFCIKWFKFLPDGILNFICIYSTTYIFILSKRNRGE